MRPSLSSVNRQSLQQSLNVQQSTLQIFGQAAGAAQFAGVAKTSSLFDLFGLNVRLGVERTVGHVFTRGAALG